MPFDQIVLFAIFFAVFALMLWGRWRYDLVAFLALLVAVALGTIPVEDAFMGFGNEATIIVALVLVVSRGLVNSGAVEIITRQVVGGGRGLGSHIALMGGIGAVLSAFMNNVAALALLMPVDLQTAQRAGRGPGLTLMPLAFATILGGMVTLIGTPPNIIISQIRARSLDGPFRMFDFAPVGLACATVGLIFVALIGWRLLPTRVRSGGGEESLFDLDDYIAELIVGDDSPLVGKKLGEIDEETEEANVAVIGLARAKTRFSASSRYVEIRPGDVLIVEATPEGIDRFRGVAKLEVAGDKRTGSATGEGMGLTEVVVPRDSRLDGRSALALQLLRRQGVTLLGVSRHGRRFYERVARLTVRAGDILLLYGPSDRLADVTRWLGALPLAARGIGVTQHRRAALAVGIFAAAIAGATFGFVALPIALGFVVALYVLFDIVPIREVYDHIEWPVVVLLGSMIPLGIALEESGGTTLIAEGIVGLTAGMPAAAVLFVLMVVIMTLSDVLNNTATAVIGAPVAIDIAHSLNVSPDPFLMAVAVAASCAFLTPIGHKNNTLILGPGGYAFSDYWRMGLPLEILIVVTGVPAILVFWPL
ncbi:SLC13 family permease [Breoghania sp. L-A4]|uniref:SLC13 family permease n=1 Tax=Breoghania sp. L-A4 TaxID=2304600 RepID=UPI000E35BE1A|nr:SLC13 family permease [Breoghania sp. L-A4]AXS42821.1 SLC13 family permease [Breoghania sp. L-A4]